MRQADWGGEDAGEKIQKSEEKDGIFMKIAFTGLKLPEGSHKYDDPVMRALIEKYDPDKVSPYYFQLLPDAYDEAEAIVISRDTLLDLLILDMEKVETRLTRDPDSEEEALLHKALKHLEQEQPLCDMPADDAESAILVALAPLSLKATVILEKGDDGLDIHEIFRRVLDKSGVQFFYTAGKKEVHAWRVRKHSDAVTCAGKIHSDLARGFVRAEVVAFEDLMTVHSMQDALKQGLAKVVEKDYIVPPNSIIEIRFSV
jgi:hypothetical protein